MPAHLHHSGTEPEPSDRERAGSSVASNPPGRDPLGADLTHPTHRLQRAVGNAAVCRMLVQGGMPSPSGGESVARKTLPQAGLADGLTGPEGKPRRVVGEVGVGGGLDGSVYASAAVGPFADKEKALMAASQVAGEIGQRLDAWGRKGQIGGTKTWGPAKMFTREKEQLNRGDVATLDPFFHRVTATYKVGEKQETLEFIYQHAATLQGYVESVSDTGNPGATTAATMFFGRDRADPHGNRNPQYANLHEPTQEKLILGLAKENTPAGLDAYTKLAGEGARFMCVRNNMSKVSNDTYFYCSVKGDRTKVYTVRFDELWVAWATKFDKRYNIANSMVIDLLRKGRLGQMDPKDTVVLGADVDLER
jgi:hypothetical protein